MKRILVFGAGRSAYYTVQYLLQKEKDGKLSLTVADVTAENLQIVSEGYPESRTILVNVLEEEQRQVLVSSHDIIISLLPARFHNLVAADCLSFRKQLITPSYITPEIQAMGEEVKQAGLLFLNELGLDPGIDHMSAMKIIHDLQDKGAKITSFKSWCGGIVAEESDDNPWHYKFSWNPYNVIRAGSDGGLCRKDSVLKYVPYHRLFRETETVEIPGSGAFEGYYNRNSLPYIELYGLQDAATFLRGTLRYPGFCRRWDFLLQSGITQDKAHLEDVGNLSLKQFFKTFLPQPDLSAESAFQQLTGQAPDADDLEALRSIGVESNEKLPVAEGTPAEILQAILEPRWAMKPHDKDRIVMVHEFEYELDGERFRLLSSLDMTGEDEHRTAMAKTVGLPLALAAELIAEEKLPVTGVVLPTDALIYEPLMAKLDAFGIRFTEHLEPLHQSEEA